MHNLIQDIRYAARTLRRNPDFTAVAILALALGIGANTAVFTVLNGVLLRPLPFEQPARLFLISRGPERGRGSAPGLQDRDFLEFQRRDRFFERVATFSGNSATLTGAGDPVRVSGASVTPDFFPVLRVNPAIGRTLLAEEGQPGSDTVVLGDKLWRSRFGADPHILGRSITLDGTAHEVAGVMPAGFMFPPDAEFWTSLVVRADPHMTLRRPVVGRLKPGVSPAQAQAELESITGGPRASGPGRRQVAQVLPLKELLVGNVRKSLVVFAGAVAFVLLIACANVANLLLMRAASRQQEIAVRVALGAGRGRLMRQLLTESTLVALAGGASGMLLALWGVPALLALAPAVPRLGEIHIDGWVLAFTFGLSVLTGLIFGLAPALQSTRHELRDALSRGARTVTGRRQVLRSVLVVSEIALALVLLTGAGLMLKSFLRMRAVNPGFRPESVLTMSVDLPDSAYRTTADMRAFHERTLARLGTLPGVFAAGAVNWMPFTGMWIRGNFQLEGGQRPHEDFLVAKPGVSPHYFRAMGIRVLSGREFTESDNATAPGVAIVSQRVARQLWPGENPVGKRISLEDHPKPEDWLTIVGVVDDVRQQSLIKDTEAAIYQPLPQVTQPFFLSHITFTVRMSTDARGVAAAMCGVLREVDRDQPAPAIVRMDDLIAATTAESLFQTRLLAGFSLLALVLSAIGIYGVVAYSVTERTQEIGIRMALGARTGDVMRMVLLRTAALATAGVAFGAASALAITRVLEKFLFQVKPTDQTTFVATASLLAAVALCAGLIPARRASRVDPLVALRHE